MKAISLWQPWASLIAFGEKEWETRGRRTHHRGLIAIHAAQTKEQAILVSRCAPFKEVLRRHGVDDWIELPFGAVVAVAQVTECVSTTEWLRKFCKTPTNRRSDREYCFGDYGPGRFAWRMSDVTRLSTPIPYRGRQSFFDIDAETTARIMEERGRIQGARRAHQIREYELFRDGSGPS